MFWRPTWKANIYGLGATVWPHLCQDITWQRRLMRCLILIWNVVLMAWHVSTSTSVFVVRSHGYSVTRSIHWCHWGVGHLPDFNRWVAPPVAFWERRRLTREHVEVLKISPDKRKTATIVLVKWRMDWIPLSCDGFRHHRVFVYCSVKTYPTSTKMNPIA